MVLQMAEHVRFLMKRARCPEQVATGGNAPPAAPDHAAVPLTATQLVPCTECGKQSRVIGLTGCSCCMLCSSRQGRGLTLVDLTNILYQERAIEGAKGGKLRTLCVHSCWWEHSSKFAGLTWFMYGFTHVGVSQRSIRGGAGTFFTQLTGKPHW